MTDGRGPVNSRPTPPHLICFVLNPVALAKLGNRRFPASQGLVLARSVLYLFTRTVGRDPDRGFETPRKAEGVDRINVATRPKRSGWRRRMFRLPPRGWLKVVAVVFARLSNTPATLRNQGGWFCFETTHRYERIPSRLDTRPLPRRQSSLFGV